MLTVAGVGGLEGVDGVMMESIHAAYGSTRVSKD
jgi:hypothetical protein